MSKNVLSTDWNLFTAGLYMGSVAETLNLIATPNDGMTTKISDVGKAKTYARINDELRRRNINYQISDMFTDSMKHTVAILLFIPRFIELNQLATALNLLSEDYNQRNG